MAIYVALFLVNIDTIITVVYWMILSKIVMELFADSRYVNTEQRRLLSWSIDFLHVVATKILT